MPAIISAPETPTTTSAPLPAIARWLMPSVADLLFIVISIPFCFGAPSFLLRDGGDTAWHILNGEHILRTHSVPHSDFFSSSAAGRPWFAWEWLYDIFSGAAHLLLGMNGVVLFHACVVATGFALLFEFLRRRTGDLLVSAVFTLLSLCCAMVHMLARPHVFSWIFTLFALVILDRATRDRRRLVWFPLLIALWANIHGGFIVGIALCVLYAVSQLWTDWRSAGNYAASRAYAITTAASIVAGCVNPYGIALYRHIVQYLANPYFMNRISEFHSPDFHQSAEKVFELLLLLSMAVLALARRVRLRDLLLVLAAAHLALLSVRNLPIAAIILSWTAAPLCSDLLSQWTEDATGALHTVLAEGRELSDRLASTDAQFRRHIIPALVLLCVLTVVAMRPARGSGHFDPGQYPVAASSILHQRGATGHVFAPDNWGGYLLYEFHPSFKVLVDDRHDFYGEDFIRGYVATISADRNWRVFLNQHAADYILLPPDARLTTTLREVSDWKLIYEDKTAVLFQRATPAN